MPLQVFIDALVGKSQTDEETDQLARQYGYLEAFFAVMTGVYFVLEQNPVLRGYLAANMLKSAAIAWQVPRTYSRLIPSLVFLECFFSTKAILAGEGAAASFSQQELVIGIAWNGVEMLASAALIRGTFAYRRRRGYSVDWGSVILPSIALFVVTAAALLTLPVLLSEPWAVFSFNVVIGCGIILWLVPRIELRMREPKYIKFDFLGGSTAQPPEGQPLASPQPRPAPSNATQNLAPSARSPERIAATPVRTRSRAAPTLWSPSRTVSSPQSPPPTPKEETPDPWVGKTLGDKLRVEAVAGRGGAGAVYRARHIDLDVLFAVKIIPKRDNLQIERFIREARLASNIPSDRVVRVLDCIEEEKFLYLTMEWIDGGTLADRLEAHGPLEIDQACEVMEDILDGLSAAHELGIVHRDVKPANIMLSSRGALLADFGIAREENSSTITRHGAMLGTPAYVSPEQVLGEPLDARSDLYSLGVVLFESVAGALPFAGSNPLALMMARVDESPQRLDVALPGTPMALATLVHRALATKPTQRFGSAAELKAAITRFRNGGA